MWGWEVSGVGGLNLIRWVWPDGIGAQPIRAKQSWGGGAEPHLLLPCTMPSLGKRLSQQGRENILLKSPLMEPSQPGGLGGGTRRWQVWEGHLLEIVSLAGFDVESRTAVTIQTDG